MFLNFLIVILTLQLVIIIHECGHALVARNNNFELISFNVGFGPNILSWKIGKLPVNIRLIPFGGFVAIKGLSTQNRDTLACIKVILSGPIFNFIAALIAFNLLFLIGYYEIKPRIETKQPVYINTVNNKIVSTWNEAYSKIMVGLFWNKKNTIVLTNKKINYQIEDLSFMSPKPILEQLGITPWQPLMAPIILNSNIKSIQKNDRIISVNNQSISNWNEFLKLYSKSPNPVLIKVKRNGSIYQHAIKKPYFHMPFEPIPPKWPRTEVVFIKFNLIYSTLYAMKRFWDTLSYQGAILLAAFFGLVPLDAFAGPIGITSTLTQSLNGSFLVWIVMFCILNIAIGLVNLLPIPGLDGGQALLTILNRLINFKISLRWERLIQRVIFILFGILIIHVTLNDIEKLLIQAISN